MAAPLALPSKLIVFIAGCATAVLLALTAAAPSADASACGRWGDSAPTSLTNGQARKAILCLVNNERDQHGLSDLNRDKRLQKAAQRHNRAMDGTGCFDHECGGERELEARLQSAGYLAGGLSRWAYGENIAWGIRGFGTPSSIVDAWMHSPEHRANILNGDFREIGVGFSAGTPGGGSEPGGIYTTDLGLRVG